MNIMKKGILSKEIKNMGKVLLEKSTKNVNNNLNKYLYYELNNFQTDDLKIDTF